MYSKFSRPNVTGLEQQTRREELALKSSRIITLVRQRQHPVHPLHTTKTSSPNRSFP